MQTNKFSFEDLRVYQTSRILVKNIYILINQLPKEESFALGAQLRRASVSITANIAESSGRKSEKEKIYFINISYASLMEVFSKLLTACDLGYITEKQIDEIRPQFINIAKMLSGLRNSFEKENG